MRVREVALWHLCSALLAVALGGCGPGDEDSGATDVSCSDVCAKHISCPNDPDPECMSDCEQLDMSCPSQNKAFRRCLLGLMDSQLVCDESGETSAGPGHCDAEATALLMCLMGGS